MILRRFSLLSFVLNHLINSALSSRNTQDKVIEPPSSPKLLACGVLLKLAELAKKNSKISDFQNFYRNFLCIKLKLFNMNSELLFCVHIIDRILVVFYSMY